MRFGAGLAVATDSPPPTFLCRSFSPIAPSPSGSVSKYRMFRREGGRGEKTPSSASSPPSAKATLSIGRDVKKKCTKEGRRGPFVAPFRRQCALLLPFYPLHALFQRRYFVLPFRKQRSCPPSLVSWRRRRRRRLHRVVARAAPALKFLWRAISR